MAGYRMTPEEAERDLADLGRHLDAGAPGGAFDATLAGIRLRFGAGRLAELGRAARGLGARRALVVTDPGVRAAGHLATALGALEAEGREPAVLFDRVPENPTGADVAAGAAAAAGADPPVDLIVAVGGGSALDCAKGINLLLTNGGAMEDYWGFGKATRPLLPSLGVPTTAGTGSEAQSYALITHPESRRKMACGDLGARFREVILDPALLATAPRRVRGLAGLDAVSHAVESAVTTARTAASAALARLAWERLEPALPGVLAGSPESFGPMLLGAHLAGAAIEQSMLGAAHAAANPLTARFAVPHGAAVALMLPHVIRHNAPAAAEPYAELAGGGGPTGSAAERLAARIEELRALAGLPGTLAEAGVPAEALPELAAAATEEWTGRFNPRPMRREDFLALYRAAGSHPPP